MHPLDRDSTKNTIAYKGTPKLETMYVNLKKKMAPSMHAAEPLRLPTVTLTPGVIKALLSYTAHMHCQYSRVSA